MKAFIAITLLAACAAAQTFDYQTGLKQHLLKKELGLTNGVWDKDVYGINKDLTFDTLRNVDTYNTVQGVNILSLDELVRHPLFQTYIHLPLFRQHFTHPLFQKYLVTPYFQKFWTHPIFPTFFRSTHLFNKFIFPVVYNTIPTTGVEYDREFDLGLNTIVGEHKNFPLNFDHTQYAHVMDKIFKHLLVNKPEILEVKTDVKIQTHPVETTVVKRVDPITGEVKYVVDEYKNIEKRITPVEVINTIRKPVETVFDNELVNKVVRPVDVDTIYGNDYTKNALLKKIYLNKILRGERVIPEINNWNKYDSVYPVETVYGNDYTKNTLLQKMLLNKIIYGDRVIPEMYNINKYENTVYPRINRPVDTVYDNELLKNTLLKKIILNKVLRGERVIPEIYNLNKYETQYPRDLTYDSIFSRYPVNKYEREFETTQYPRHLINKYETIIPREFETTHYPRDWINKYQNILPREFETTQYPRHLINKYETVLPREFINKYESVLPRHLVNKYETENKLENILLKSIVA